VGRESSGEGEGVIEGRMNWDQMKWKKNCRYVCIYVLGGAFRLYENKT